MKVLVIEDSDEIEAKKIADSYEAIAKAIEEGGHTMIYSLSPGDVHHPTHLPYYKRANMLRITRDIWDNPLSIEKGFFAWEKFQGAQPHKRRG